jgi:site-specific recombinase XerD
LPRQSCCHHLLLETQSSDFRLRRVRQIQCARRACSGCRSDYNCRTHCRWYAAIRGLFSFRNSDNLTSDAPVAPPAKVSQSASHSNIFSEEEGGALQSAPKPVRDTCKHLHSVY